MKKWLFLILFLAGACVPQPAYTVKVRGFSRTSFCGGYGIDENHVLTMNHCTKHGFDRVAKQNGEVIPMRVVQTWPEVDLALLETAEPMNLEAYAQLAEGEFDTPSDLFGFCPLAPVTRPVMRATEVDWLQSYCQTWVVLGSFSCSGDSGGTVQQNGKVAGVLLTIWDWGINPDMLEGNVVCIVPASLILQKLASSKLTVRSGR